MRRSLLVVLLVAGCIEDQLVVCADGRACPAGTACDDRHASCVDPQQVSACDGQADGTACATEQIADGVCFGVCIQAGCGNGELEAGEVCEDGNTVSGDGCSSECTSREVCGDGVVDQNRGEDCDDGGTRGNDGCSSVCTPESVIMSVTGQAPSPRVDAAVTYDSVRRRLVAFGGQDNEVIFGDTWEWDGASWLALAPVLEPSPRSGSAIAYDPIRHRVVLFAGDSSEGLPLNDTWEWDGNNWTVRPTQISPPNRSGAAMAWDPTLKAVVLAGGTTLFKVYNDTWKWDGEAWTQIVTPTSFTARSQHVLVRDAAHDRLLLYGGTDSTAQARRDTWAFDGSTWTELTAAGLVPHLNWAGADGMYDPIRGKAIYAGITVGSVWETWELGDGAWTKTDATGQAPGGFGFSMSFDLDAGRALGVFGQDSGVYTNTIKSWDGANWTVVDPAPMPPARLFCGLAYDSVRDRAVLFGGANSEDETAWDPTTWEWDGSRWSEAASTGPTRRFGHAMVYDAMRKNVVLFGGDTTGETWTWDGSSWMRHDVSPSPPARAYAALAFDEARGRVVLFGGTEVADTWEWDGTRWYEVTPTVMPPPRERTAMAYDAKRRRVVMFGGIDSAQTLVDLWEWDGSTWTEMTPPITPEPRYGHAMVYDRARERINVFAGVPLLSFSMWEWDGTRWNAPSVNSQPFPRQGMCASYDATRRQIIGYSGGFLDPTPDMWTAAYRGADEVCLSGMDVDGDGQTGCADEDCAAVCAGCGDGACSPLENDRLCPQDCTVSSAICGDDYCAPAEAATCPSDC